MYSALPPLAVVAGHDSDQDPIYVGRAVHNGDVLPAKVIPNKQQAYVAWGGEEINKHDVEILTGHNYCWVSASNGSVPPHALRVGRTSDGEPLYVGRGYFAGSLTPGKVHPSHGCLYIPYGGAEQRLEAYEVLVMPETWVPSSGSHIIPGTIYAGNDADGDPIYVGRAYHDGDLLPAKVRNPDSILAVPSLIHSLSLFLGHSQQGLRLCGPRRWGTCQVRVRAARGLRLRLGGRLLRQCATQCRRLRQHLRWGTALHWTWSSSW